MPVAVQSFQQIGTDLNTNTVLPVINVTMRQRKMTKTGFTNARNKSYCRANAVSNICSAMTEVKRTAKYTYVAK